MSIFSFRKSKRNITENTTKNGIKMLIFCPFCRLPFMRHESKENCKFCRKNYTRLRNIPQGYLEIDFEVRMTHPVWGEMVSFEYDIDANKYFWILKEGFKNTEINLLGDRNGPFLIKWGIRSLPVV